MLYSHLLYKSKWLAKQINVSRLVYYLELYEKSAKYISDTNSLSRCTYAITVIDLDSIA